MGTIKQGILGGFSGKVGTIVGGSWKGVSYMRSPAQNIKNPRTAAQMGQRTKFGLVSADLQPLTPILRTGWKLHADGKSAFNAATAHTLANAITGTYPDYAIDPARILIARGSLTPAAGASVALTEGDIRITWNDNSGTDAAKQTDRALITITCPAQRAAITNEDDATRADCCFPTPLPDEWIDATLHTYLGFISEDGREVANSIYLGFLNN